MSTVNLPITLDHDRTRIVGRVILRRDAMPEDLASDLVLHPAHDGKQVLEFAITSGEPATPIKTTFTNKSKRIWSEEEARVMVNAALAKLIDDAGGLISISVADLFKVAPMGTLAMALSDDDKILTLTRIARES
jgi:hypothetical protein